MSYQVDQTCYDTAVKAAQAAVSKSEGAVFTAGTSMYVANVTSVVTSGADSANVTWAFNQVGSSNVMSKVVGYNAQPCNLMTASDALAMSWLVVGAWAAVYAVMFLTRALRGETGGDYGNA